MAVNFESIVNKTKDSLINYHGFAKDNYCLIISPPGFAVNPYQYWEGGLEQYLAQSKRAGVLFINEGELRVYGYAINGDGSSSYVEEHKSPKEFINRIMMMGCVCGLTNKQLIGAQGLLDKAIIINDWAVSYDDSSEELVTGRLLDSDLEFKKMSASEMAELLIFYEDYLVSEVKSLT